MSNNNDEGNNMKAQDIFSEYLNFNNFHNDIMKEDFPKPNLDSYDKFNLSDESSIKSVNSMNEYSKTNLFNKSMTFESQPQSPKKYHFVNISNINNINNNNNIINNFDNIKRINFNGKNDFSLNLKKNINKDIIIHNLEHQMISDSYDNIMVEYSKIIIHFGYIIFFSVASPLTPLFVFCLFILKDYVILIKYFI
jgi:hypothetical protein